MTATPDGYEVRGADIGPGVDLEYGVTVEQLPRESAELPFRTLLRYSGGREDAWIESATENNPDPEMPAPTIAVAPAPPLPTATPSSSPPSAPSTTVDAAPSAEPQEASAAAEDSSSSTDLVVAGVVVAAALAGGLWFRRSRASRRV